MSSCYPHDICVALLSKFMFFGAAWWGWERGRYYYLIHTYVCKCKRWERHFIWTVSYTTCNCSITLSLQVHEDHGDNCHSVRTMAIIVTAWGQLSQHEGHGDNCHSVRTMAIIVTMWARPMLIIIILFWASKFFINFVNVLDAWFWPQCLCL